MPARTITLSDELVERLEALAWLQGRTLDEVLSDLLEQAVPASPNWALNLAEAMEAADVTWQDEAALSAHSREHYQQHRYEQWQPTQDIGDDE